MTVDLLATGWRFHQAGDLPRAEEAYRQFVQREPGDARGWYLLGILCQSHGDLATAAARFQQALQLHPDFPEASNSLGYTLAALGRLDEAIACYHHALRLRPDYAEALNNLGLAFRAQKKLAEAEASYRHAVRLRPELAEAHNNLGLALLDQERPAEAAACLQRTVQLRPRDARAQNNLGTALRCLGRFEEAARSLRESVRLQPAFAEAHKNLGNVLRDLGNLDEAESSLAEAVRLKPNYPEAYLDLGNVFKDQARLDDMLAAYRSAQRLKPDAAAFHSNLVYALSYHPDYDAPAILEEARRWNEQHAEPLRGCIQPHTHHPEPERRLRIGYVSPDFRQHATAFFTFPLLAHHDHDAFEIYCYASVRRPDPLTERFRGQADVWHNVLSLSDEQLAERIRRDQVDILVDLTMHMADNRLLVFAREPAPVQVCWAAYPGTTGMSTIAYRLTDPYLDPPGMFDACYAEESVRLADTFWCYDPLLEPVPITALPAAQQGHVTFGCLNNFCKLNAGVLALWARVLQAVPESRLLLLAPRGRAREWVLARLEQESVAAARVEFVEMRPRREYFQLYERVDLALDPLPYNGHTTSVDGFWMGVPTVTLVGQTVAGRAGWSQLCNLGLTELAAQTPEQYVRLAAELAGDLPRLQVLRGTLRQRLEQSPLMDAPRFARQVEQAYRGMWQRWCRSPE